MSHLPLDVALPPGAPAVKFTERDLLDALHRRFCKPPPYRTQRFVVAEHVRLDPTWGTRIIDAIVVDTWRGKGWTGPPTQGYGLAAFEVKVSRSDLRRELSDPGKSGAFEELVDSFTIVAPTDVLRDWREMGLPAQWGVLGFDGSHLKYLRSPQVAPDRDLTLGIQHVASLTRSAVQTASAHCRRIHPEWLEGAA